MIILKIIGIVAIVIAVLFVLSLFIYFFNLDMKFASKLIKPLTAIITGQRTDVRQIRRINEYKVI